MPEFRFLVLLVDAEVLELGNLVLQLNDESDLGRGAEVTNDQETYYF